MDLASGRMEGIATLLERYKKITVPIYQRNYSWDTDQVKELLDDLVGSLQSERPHFLGCLILQDDPNDKSKCEVVDGQQRLTTVFLVLARIQDELHRLSKAGFNTIDGQGDELERNPKIEVQSLIFNQNLARPRFLSNFGVGFPNSMSMEQIYATATNSVVVILTNFPLNAFVVDWSSPMSLRATK